MYVNDVQMVSKLSMMGCDMNVKDADGEAPLLLMMREKRHSCILSLLCHGADCNVQDSKGETVLHKAVKVSAEKEKKNCLKCVLWYHYPR